MAGMRERLPLILLVAALVIVALGGGSNRTDVISLLYVRPCLIVILMAMAMLVRWHDVAAYRWPFWLMVAALLLVILQLVPLPPAIWMALPGRAPVIDAAGIQGVAQVWRPLTLTPDLTLQAGLWFLAPAAAVLGWACLPERDRPAMIMAVIILCMASAVLGGLQASQGADSPLYLYRRTYQGNGVGLLANRNHQGALLALAFPLLWVMTLLPTTSRRWARIRPIAATFCAFVLLPAILLTASRAGIALGLLGIVLAVLIAYQGPSIRFGGRVARVWPVAMAAGLVACGGLVAILGRALALDRLLGSDIESDLRVRYMSAVVTLVRTYFPAGSGLGSFDPVFRMGEPDLFLKPTFYNHAHNDYLEVILTAGLPGIMLLVAGAGWWLTRGWVLFRTPSEHDGGRDWSRSLALAAWSAILILMLASIVDYPLRTPLLGFMIALLACWMAAPGGSSLYKSTPAP